MVFERKSIGALKSGRFGRELLQFFEWLERFGLKRRPLVQPPGLATIVHQPLQRQNCHKHLTRAPGLFYRLLEVELEVDAATGNRWPGIQNGKGRASCAPEAKAPRPSTPIDSASLPGKRIDRRAWLTLPCRRAYTATRSRVVVLLHRRRLSAPVYCGLRLSG